MLKAEAAEEKTRKRAKKRREEALESMFDNGECTCIKYETQAPTVFKRIFEAWLYVYGFIGIGRGGVPIY